MSMFLLCAFAQPGVFLTAMFKAASPGLFRSRPVPSGMHGLPAKVLILFLLGLYRFVVPGMSQDDAKAAYVKLVRR